MGNRDRDHLTAAGRSNLGRRTFLKLTGTATVVATTGLVGILDSGQAPDCPGRGAPPRDGADGESITTTPNTFPHPISLQGRAPQHQLSAGDHVR